MMKHTVMLTVVLGACLMVSTAIAGDGGVGFSRNRLIYPASQKAIKITVSNHGDSPYLVQAGVYGDPVKKVSAPFVVTPPLFRLEGNSQNDIRIVAAGASLPLDRESVFYFRGTVIPGGGESDSKEGVSATLSIAMRSVMKLFWRPEGLKPSAQDAPGKMQFIREAKGVRVKNPTPYYQSFASLAFDGKTQDLDRVASMVEPFSEQLFASTGPVSKVTWQVMNDFGGTTNEITQLLSSADGE
jgi:P pilus assembly chaperone PapD